VVGVDAESLSCSPPAWVLLEMATSGIRNWDHVLNLGIVFRRVTGCTKQPSQFSHRPNLPPRWAPPPVTSAIVPDQTHLGQREGRVSTAIYEIIRRTPRKRFSRHILAGYITGPSKDSVVPRLAKALSGVNKRDKRSGWMENSALSCPTRNYTGSRAVNLIDLRNENFFDY